MSSLAENMEKLMGANASQQQVTCWLDTGFAPLNKVLSGSYKGGMPGGRIIEMFGGSSCGKTAIATKVMACAQSMGGIAAFNDHENSFDVGLGQGLGLQTEGGVWVYKQPETYEESVDLMVKMARSVRGGKWIDPQAPLVTVFDSLASMVPQSKLFDAKGNAKETGDFGMHDNMALAKCTSATFSVLAQLAYKYNMTMLFLNQTRTKPGVTHGDPTTTPGGNAPEFYATTRIQLSRSMLKDAKDASNIEGQSIRAYTKKNKAYRPFLEAHWRFMFRDDGSGYFDTTRSTIEHMKEIGLLTSAGAYVEFDGKKYHAGPLAQKIDEEDRYQELLDMLYATES